MPQMGLMSRALWHVNRTQLRWAVKSGVSAWNLKEKLERRRQAQLLEVTPVEKAKAADLNRDGYVVVTDLMDAAIQQQFAEAGSLRLKNIEIRNPSSPRPGRSSGSGCWTPRCRTAG